jgi:hypothetical protein
MMGVRGIEWEAPFSHPGLNRIFQFITVPIVESGQIDKEVVRLILYILLTRHGAFCDQQTTRKKTFLWLNHGQ